MVQTTRLLLALVREAWFGTAPAGRIQATNRLAKVYDDHDDHATADALRAAPTLTPSSVVTQSRAMGDEDVGRAAGMMLAGRCKKKTCEALAFCLDDDDLNDLAEHLQEALDARLVRPEKKAG